MMQKIITSRFGEIEYNNEDVLYFEDGLIGFENFKEFILITHKGNTLFTWLQSKDEGALAFLLCDPFAFYPEYDIEIPDEDEKKLKIQDIKDILIFTTTSIPKNAPRDATINLLAPIIVNIKEKIGRQVILDVSKYNYPTKYFILREK